MQVNFPKKYIKSFIRAMNNGHAIYKGSSEYQEVSTTLYTWADCVWWVTIADDKITGIDLAHGEINDEILLIEYLKNGK